MTQVPMKPRGRILAGVTVLIVVFTIELALMDRRVEARPYYETALRQALTIHPDFQAGLVPFLQQRLAAQDNAVQDARP